MPNILTHFIAIGLIVSSSTFAGTPIAFSLPSSLKGCREALPGSNSDNTLRNSPGYPEQNPEKNLYYVSSFRSNPGFFIIITKDDKTCSLDTKEAALKKFSELYAGAQPQKICYVANSSGIIQDCKPIERSRQRRRR